VKPWKDSKGCSLYPHFTLKKLTYSNSCKNIPLI